MASPGELSWDQFAEVVAEAAGVEAGTIEPETRLLEDLRLDSLALAEIIVMLLVDLGMYSLTGDLAEREWRQVTVGELYEEYRGLESSARRERFVIRGRLS